MRENGSGGRVRGTLATGRWWEVEGGLWRVEEGTALTLCCAPRRATPARQTGVGEVRMVCDGDGVAMQECAVCCREEEGGSAACARGPGARQETRQCQERKGRGVAAPAVPQSHCRRFRRRHSRSGAREGLCHGDTDTLQTITEGQYRDCRACILHKRNRTICDQQWDEKADDEIVHAGGWMDMEPSLGLLGEPAAPPGPWRVWRAMG